MTIDGLAEAIERVSGLFYFKKLLAVQTAILRFVWVFELNARAKKLMLMAQLKVRISTMSSQLIEAVIEALATSSSTKYVEEDTLSMLGKKEEIIQVLETLIQDRIIFCCNITRNGKSYNAYWLSVHASFSKRKQHPALFITGANNIPHSKLRKGQGRVFKEETLPDRVQIM